jgi:hypothetical protein
MKYTATEDGGSSVQLRGPKEGTLIIELLFFHESNK